MLLRATYDVVCLDVADDHERGVVWNVEAAVMTVEIVARHRPQVVDPANGRVAVRMHAEGGGRHLGVEELVGVVFASVQLGDDHRPLRLALIGLVEAVGHPLGLDEQHPVERVASGGLQVGGLVDPRVAVPHPAKALDDPFHLVARDVRRPLEIHVLDPMGHAGGPGTLIARPHAVPAPDRHQRRGVDLLDEQLETVIEDSAAQRDRGEEGVVQRHFSIIQGVFGDFDRSKASY